MKVEAFCGKSIQRVEAETESKIVGKSSNFN